MFSLIMLVLFVIIVVIPVGAFLIQIVLALLIVITSPIVNLISNVSDDIDKGHKSLEAWVQTTTFSSLFKSIITWFKSHCKDYN